MAMPTAVNEIVLAVSPNIKGFNSCAVGSASAKADVDEVYLTRSKDIRRILVKAIVYEKKD